MSCSELKTVCLGAFDLSLTVCDLHSFDLALIARFESIDESSKLNKRPFLSFRVFNGVALKLVCSSDLTLFTFNSKQFSLSENSVDSCIGFLRFQCIFKSPVTIILSSFHSKSNKRLLKRVKIFKQNPKCEFYFTYFIVKLSERRRIIFIIQFYLINKISTKLICCFK